MTQPDIHLYTAATMNGYKPVIFLEEAGVPYGLTFIDLSKQEQKAPDYLKLNPNGKIPTIVDRDEGRPIFESGAILWHLANKYGKFLSDDPVARSETLQWLFFQVGHVGPMMGQAMYFQRIAAPNGHEEPFSIKRYVDESRRLLEVLDTRLAGRDFLVDDYSIADMAVYPWARAYPWARVGIDGLANLKGWFDRIDARPAVRKALTIPKAQPAFWGDADESEFLKENAARFASDVKTA
ncbi:glutathione S-transferase N-terminal domain-containing protein [Stappia taiwanensis]|uniref:Glutathione S-transferase N-terminal domain-containing protein n=1 Tax=Stappia taiwanensis TaxID=992267 RepID=A0A838Y321_9HYPH|nr:glutathione S-transferase N-terminal domain-containing protein [Stappia taiwanensis]MBA4613584.1 glutathione S-transferase N-terminal domain-containing protein [Stappia taiwanensis]GGE99004.1 thiol:disulfide oxidoreductase [Stappia taiwanensis]